MPAGRGGKVMLKSKLFTNWSFGLCKEYREQAVGKAFTVTIGFLTEPLGRVQDLFSWLWVLLLSPLQKSLSLYFDSLGNCTTYTFERPDLVLGKRE